MSAPSRCTDKCHALPEGGWFHDHGPQFSLSEWGREQIAKGHTPTVVWATDEGTEGVAR